MKWTKRELIIKPYIEFDEDIEFDKSSLDNNKLLLDVEDLHVEGDGTFDEVEDLLRVNMHITGTMICPCAITNEPLSVDLDSDYDECFAFHDTNDLDVHVVKNDVIELIPVIFQLINLDVPMHVVKEGIAKYPSGDGWRILSEDEYQKAKRSSIDPRLAKLREFKAED